MQVKNKKLEGQVAIVTGASSGIGAGIAKALAAAGAHVAVNFASSADKAEAVLKEITDLNGKGFTCKADVSQEQDVLRLFKETINRFGTVDILINNAGLQNDARFHEMTLTQWNKVIDTNLTGQFLCAREAVNGTTLFVDGGMLLYQGFEDNG